MDECFSCSGRQRGTEPCNIAKVKEGNFGDVVDMRYKGKGRIKDGSKVADAGGSGDIGANDVEGKGLGMSGEGVRTNYENL